MRRASLLPPQWVDEAQSKLAADSGLRIHVFHGDKRVKCAATLAAEFDLVVTTYAHVGKSFSTGGPLHAVEWRRVVLDESHEIKNASASNSRGCTALAAGRRWCVTGTPISGNVYDLVSQFAFLNLVPWSQPAFFAANGGNVFDPSTSFGNASMAVPLVYALRRVMVRHTKSQKLGGEDVLKLPAKHERLLSVVFTDDERAAYDAARALAVAQWISISALGASAVSRNVLGLRSLLRPLQRLASGGALKAADVRVPDLAKEAEARRAERAAKDAAAAAAAPPPAYAFKPDPSAAGGAGPSFKAKSAAGAGAGAAARAAEEEVTRDAKPVVSAAPEADEECGLCSELVEEPVRTGCGHWFCKARGPFASASASHGARARAHAGRC